MSISETERREIENEMLFRRTNEEAVQALETLDAMHAKYGHIDLINSEDLELHFKCECSDENCHQRIPISSDKYQAIHKNRDTFIIIPGHQVDAIEEVVKKTPLYYVVRKNKIVAEPSDTLNSTDIEN